MIFVPGWNPCAVPSDSDLIITFHDNLVYFDFENVAFQKYSAYMDMLDERPPAPIFLGMFADKKFFLAAPESIAPQKQYLGDTRGLYSILDPNKLEAVSSAKMIFHWLSKHKYCGQCREKLQPSSTERALLCQSCEAVYYPKVSPAVITAILDGDRILLGHNKRFPDGLYSLIAGFIDPGESAENAVMREVKEETGVNVTDITYLGSQAWPFPDSLMLGFSARYSGGDILCDDDEITDAQWFTKDTLPNMPGKGSIARKILEEVFPHLNEKQ